LVESGSQAGYATESFVPDHKPLFKRQVAEFSLLSKNRGGNYVGGVSVVLAEFLENEIPRSLQVPTLNTVGILIMCMNLFVYAEEELICMLH
jgi:hypothetical protein